MHRLATAAAVFCLAALPALAADVAPMGDDGLHKPEWLRDTFKDLREDAAEAAAEGKRLVLIVEQRGCIYCHEMHEKTFPDERITALLTDEYFPVQLNLHGDIDIVDTDGEELSEKEAARKWNVLFTPTIVFLPPGGRRDDVGHRSGRRCHAGRVRSGHDAGHAHLGAGRALSRPVGRGFPALPRAAHPRARGRQHGIDVTRREWLRARRWRRASEARRSVGHRP